MADIDDIFKLLVVMHGENGVVPMDAAKVYGTIQHMIESGIVLVVKMDGEVIGSGAWSEQEYWYSRVARLGECWFFVHPDHRRSGAVHGLVDMAKMMATETKLPFEINVSSPIKLGVKMRFFRKLGLQLIGATFLSQEGR